jgi:hypothetical protein
MREAQELTTDRSALLELEASLFCLTSASTVDATVGLNQLEVDFFVLLSFIFKIRQKKHVP